MEINVLIEEGLEGCPDVNWLQGVAEQTLVMEDVGAGAEMGLVITTQERVRELNRSYRGKDEPTDVLAFSSREESGTGFPPFIQPPDGVLHLGEVIISYPQAVIQAKAHRHSMEKEIAVLIIHGVLHLLGYEHDKPELKQQMTARERAILSYIEQRLK